MPLTAAGPKAPILSVNEAPLPALGFGTSQLRGDACVRSVSEALAAGYRHIDTAVMYGNEAEVGRALKQSGLKRDEMFVTTKVLPGEIGRGGCRPPRAQASIGSGSTGWTCCSSIGRRTRTYL